MEKCQFQKRKKRRKNRTSGSGLHRQKKRGRKIAPRSRSVGKHFKKKKERRKRKLRLGHAGFVPLAPSLPHRISRSAAAAAARTPLLLLRLPRRPLGCIARPPPPPRCSSAARARLLLRLRRGGLVLPGPGGAREVTVAQAQAAIRLSSPAHITRGCPAAAARRRSCHCRRFCCL
ncbi:hypothetical protein VPH35_057799 [Triticum aestivum]